MRTAQARDEIDIELIGGRPTQWQTNLFAPAPIETKPLYKTFSSLQDFLHGPKTLEGTHSYTIDWSPERIIWSVDGSEVRTLRAGASVVASPRSCLVADVHTMGCCRRDGTERHGPLSLAPVAPSVRHLGRERTCRHLRVGARPYRLGICAEEDERGVRRRRSRVSILDAMNEL